MFCIILNLTQTIFLKFIFFFFSSTAKYRQFAFSAFKISQIFIFLVPSFQRSINISFSLWLLFPNLLKFVLTLQTHHYILPPIRRFPRFFPTKITYTFIVFKSYYMPCPSYHYNFTVLTISRRRAGCIATPLIMQQA
jgi:hypothetical protein